MDRIGKSALLVGVLAVVLMVGCESGKTEGQKQVETLTARINSFAEALASAKTELNNVLGSHDNIVHNKDGQLDVHFGQFNKGLDRLESRSEDLRARIDQVKQVATPYFAQWEAKLKQIQNENTQQMARQRMEKTKNEYEEFIGWSEQMRDAYTPLMDILRDHKQYWSYSLNASAAADLQKDDDKIKEHSAKLIELIDTALQGAKEYNEAVAARTTPEEDAPAKEAPAE